MILARIENKIKKTDYCWIWTAFKNQFGYGSAKWNGRMRPAHRVVWEMVNGEIPGDMMVLHKCDNRSCVNPSHLFLGTQIDNMRDMYAKGRQPNRAAENNGNSKLTWADIYLIRSMWPKLSTYKLGKKFGVTNTLIHQIVKGKIWREKL